MTNNCTTLEETAISSSSTPQCWKGFDKPVQETYEPASIFGWPPIKINCGDIDSVAYRKKEN